MLLCIFREKSVPLNVTYGFGATVFVLKIEVTSASSGYDYSPLIDMLSGIDVL